ncbi:uncharacterized protein YjiK [Lewinella marina]|uniref:SMP-30/Gluconolactonase/LRE-like region domain-containing protein n=1 Tax=Neolewinella marina TaxID=438751 RepID=A0A2G0CGG7_9BACT|nr:SdiA-regulated domain-containing protein [Neolewinella marina]NJB86466.1 uncharacterized protein YjiK [Neolewinella marina]PHK99074.1 hypothetical protein CGL56_06330 [Neolewinella marina]
MHPYLIALLLLLSIGTCGPAPLAAQFPYDLDNPQLVGELPEELDEISGLTIRNGDLLAVEDEYGILYRLALADGSILERTEFWESGDYEGLATVGENEVWVTKSNGRLYRITAPGTNEQRVKEYNTWLKGENDVEGLAYDATRNRLLLACKDDPKGNGMSKENRYIFAFDLETKKLGEEAAYSIPREDDFSPSALAIHPLTGQLFLTSSVGNRLLVADAEGRIETVRKLDKRFLPQAEGLAFTADGTLYISTEARDGEPARIYRLPLAP